ncbi:MAG: YfiR family protein [Deltaproteobacteria bacterium]|nr:YfiR family protein [Deltaproteobacteria bacterium]
MALTRRRFLLGVAGGLSALARGRAGPSSPPTDPEVKAAIVLNLARFTEWPPGTFSDAGTPLVVCVWGEDPVSHALGGIRGETAGGHPVVLRAVASPDRLQGCHVAYVARSERRHVAGILTALRGRPVLSVSDIEGFAAWGGAVSFWTLGGRVRFDVNPAALRHAGLKVSSKVLRLARLVEEAAP